MLKIANYRFVPRNHHFVLRNHHFVPKKIISYEKFAKNYQIRQKLSQNCTKCLIKFAKVIKFAKMAQKWFNLRKSAKKAKLPNLLAKSLKMSQISKILKICEKL